MAAAFELNGTVAETYGTAFGVHLACITSSSSSLSQVAVVCWRHSVFPILLCVAQCVRYKLPGCFQGCRKSFMRAWLTHPIWSFCCPV